jgi:hypothetical protein
VLHAVRAGVAGVLGDRPAVGAWQVSKQTEHERPGPPPHFHPAEPARDPAQERIERRPPSRKVYAVTRGHRVIFGCRHNTE